MAGLNPTLERSAGRRAATGAVNLPRLVMSWEDWLTFGAVLIAFGAIAVTIEQAEWVNNMPRLFPTTVAALVVGLVAARMRVNALLIQPFVLLAGVFVVVAAVQNYADGATVSDRLADFSDRMREWWAIVRAGDISNDNLPFVLLVHSATFLAAYFGAWSIYRWHNPWIALVPGGFVLLSTISFMDNKPGGALFFFLVGSLFIVARAHLQKSQARWKAEGVEYPDWISLNALNLTFLVSLLLLIVAWQLPIAREAGAAQSLVSAVTKPFEPLNQHAIRLFHNINGASGGNFHNFGDSLPIRGEVSLGSKALYEVNSGEAGYIRGTSYDEYTGVGWKSTDRDDQNVDAGHQSLETYAERTTTILRVTVADQASTVLTLGTALGTNLDSVADFDSTNPADVERVTSRRGLDSGDTYNSVGSRSTASADQLRAAGTVYPDWVTAKYLQLPADLPDRVRVEAARVTNGAETPYDIAFLTQRYLRTFPYDLSVPAAPPGRDAVDYLLFDLRRGYFDPLSTAMCVMLRTQEVPCRVAVGYALDPSDAEETSYTVRKNDAYAWVEVWFPTFGWVEFNPTSDRPAGGAGPGTGLEGQLPVAPGAEDPFANIDDIINSQELPGATLDPDATGALGESALDQQGRPWFLIWTLTAVLAVLAAGALAARITWNWGLAGLEGRARLWARTQKLTGWAGLGGPSSETPREWSRRVGPVVHREEDAALLADAYQEARYGPPDLDRTDDDEASQAYRGLRRALFGKITRWKGPAARPGAAPK